MLSTTLRISPCTAPLRLTRGFGSLFPSGLFPAGLVSARFAQQPLSGASYQETGNKAAGPIARGLQPLGRLDSAKAKDGGPQRIWASVFRISPGRGLLPLFPALDLSEESSICQKGSSGHLQVREQTENQHKRLEVTSKPEI